MTLVSDTVTAQYRADGGPGTKSVFLAAPAGRKPAARKPSVTVGTNRAGRFSVQSLEKSQAVRTVPTTITDRHEARLQETFARDKTGLSRLPASFYPCRVPCGVSPQTVDLAPVFLLLAPALRLLRAARSAFESAR